MCANIQKEAVKLLLAAMYQPEGRGRTQAFMYGPIGANDWEKSFGTELYYDESLLVKAVLHVRRVGPAYLRKMPFESIRSMLMNFVSDNFWYLADESFETFSGSYAENTTGQSHDSLAEALAASEVFQPRNRLTVFPLVPVEVADNFDSDIFFLIDADSLGGDRLPNWVEADGIVSDQYPPIRDWKGTKNTPTSWLGIRSPAVQASNRIKAAILGALALTPLPQYRHMCSMRSMFGGCCTFDNSFTVTFPAPATPALMENIVVTNDDHEWLEILSTKVMSASKVTRREIRALEYFYRAWFLDHSERFPILCMALDSIYGDANHASQAVIDGIRNLLGDGIEEDRLRLITNLRAAVIHGGAPEVYDSKKYAKYYDNYGSDPVGDIGIVIAECLRRKIFGQTLREHTDPHAMLIAEAEASGHIPASKRGSILDGESRD